MTIGRPGSSGSFGSDLRIGDSDREAAVSALGEHYAAGRLTKEEYDERSDIVWAARTGSDLGPLFADLPRLVGAAHQDQRQEPERSRRGHPGWWRGARLTPLLLVVVALVVVTHLPLFVLFLVFWLLWARMWRFRSGGERRHDRGRQDRRVR